MTSPKRTARSRETGLPAATSGPRDHRDRPDAADAGTIGRLADLRRLGSAWRSTTLGPVTPRSATSNGSRSTSSRSTRRSSPASPRAATARPSRERSSSSDEPSSSRSSPRASSARSGRLADQPRLPAGPRLPVLATDGHRRHRGVPSGRRDPPGPGTGRVPTVDAHIVRRRAAPKLRLVSGE